MTLIDQRILIDAPPQVVWEYISDPNHVRRWHAGYRTISVLTTQQFGLGTRRRCTPATGGKDVIEEITAWVDGLGYEYTQVEGGTFRAMRARIRLQAGPDGTTVQWTVTYKPRGVTGMLRDLFGGKRDMQSVMANSLRQLRRQIDELGLRMDAEYRQRVSMRGRLNHDERQQYALRHVPDDDHVPVAAEGDAQPAAEIPGPVPPASDGGTDLPAVPIPIPDQIAPPVPPAAVPEPDIVEDEPSFVGDLLRGADAAPGGAPQDQPAGEAVPQGAGSQPSGPPIPPRPIPEVSPLYSKAPTRPLDPSTGTGRADDAAPEQDEAEAAVPAPDLHTRPTPPRGITSVRAQTTMHPVSPEHAERASPSPARPVPPPEASLAPTPPHGIQSIQRPAASAPPARRANVPPPTPKADTGEISIWEVFGTPRPSEQDASALRDLIQSVTAKETAEFRRRRRWAKRPARVRYLQAVTGLRARFRLQQARVRHTRRSSRTD